jgi:hypothetical protein
VQDYPLNKWAEKVVDRRAAESHQDKDAVQIEGVVYQDGNYLYINTNPENPRTLYRVAANDLEGERQKTRMARVRGQDQQLERVWIKCSFRDIAILAG